MELPDIHKYSQVFLPMMPLPCLRDLKIKGGFHGRCRKDKEQPGIQNEYWIEGSYDRSEKKDVPPGRQDESLTKGLYRSFYQSILSFMSTLPSWSLRLIFILLNGTYGVCSSTCVDEAVIPVNVNYTIPCNFTTDDIYDAQWALNGEPLIGLRADGNEIPGYYLSETGALTIVQANKHHEGTYTLFRFAKDGESDNAPQTQIYVQEPTTTPQIVPSSAFKEATPEGRTNPPKNNPWMTSTIVLTVFCIVSIVGYLLLLFRKLK